MAFGHEYEYEILTNHKIYSMGAILVTILYTNLKKTQVTDTLISTLKSIFSSEITRPCKNPNQCGFVYEMIDYITGFSFLIIDFYATLYLHIGKLNILINFANTWFDYQLNITELQNFK